MNQKEADRLHVMKLLANKQINLRRASELMKVSKSQSIRIKKAYLAFGIKGLVSKRRGKPSPNKMSNILKEKIISLIKENYSDFGPTLACEKLSEDHSISVSVETIRKIMTEACLWISRKHKQVVVHQMRSRRSKFGELIQIDGSYHRWFEDRADKCCLILFVDDATGKITSAKFCIHETTIDYLDTLKNHLKRYGKPMAFYSDKHTVFKVTQKKEFSGKEITHFGQVLKDLNMTLICANSPQAKGRVERKNGVLQDRLIKEMRLRKISSIEEGNIFLEEYIAKHNIKFGKKALSKEDAHRPIKFNEDLEKIFARKISRKLSKNLTFEYQGVLYQINPKEATFGMKHAGVTVINKGNDIEVLYNAQKLSFKKYYKIEDQAQIVCQKNIEAWLNKKERKTSKKHPWR